MDRTARIILLNGVGSAGKTSIAKALQTITAEPFLYVAMDAFLEMLPEASWGTADGITFETALEDGKPSVVIHSGPLAERALRGMREAVAAMARAGSDIIVDDVMMGSEIAEYRSLLAGFTLFTVGVFAPLDVLEARERERGDRAIGLARWQYPRVHRDKSYDLEIDTSRASALECAKIIQQKFRL